MRSNLTSFLEQAGGRAVLLSLLPRYAKQIVGGTKRVEFRRSWTAEPVSLLTLYATSPTSRVIGVASVKKVVEASPTALWRYAQEYGGGVTRSELYAYLDGKKTGFAVFLGQVQLFDPPLDPRQGANGFRAPQSFRFLLPDEFQQLMKASTSHAGGIK